MMSDPPNVLFSSVDTPCTGVCLQHLFCLMHFVFGSLPCSHFLSLARDLSAFFACRYRFAQPPLLSLNRLVACTLRSPSGLGCPMLVFPAHAHKSLYPSFLTNLPRLGRPLVHVRFNVFHSGDSLLLLDISLCNGTVALQKRLLFQELGNSVPVVLPPE